MLLFLLLLFVLQSSDSVMKCVTLDVCRKLLETKEMDECGSSVVSILSSSRMEQKCTRRKREAIEGIVSVSVHED
jgi:hypothetical protein